MKYYLKNHLNIKKYLSIFIIIFLILLSLTITIFLREKYPTLSIYREEWKKDKIKLDYDEQGCSQIIEELITLNESTVKEGEKLIFYINFSNEIKGVSSKIGFDKEKLIELKKGKNKIGMFYYKHQKNNYYMQFCKTEANIAGKGNYHINIERPSFVDSFAGSIISFFGFFILFVQSIISFKKLTILFK